MKLSTNAKVLVWQVSLAVVAILLWDILPRIAWIKQNTVLDPVFVSSPSLVAVRIGEFAFGSLAGWAWKQVAWTIGVTLLGLFMGMVSGFLAALALSQFRIAYELLRPVIVAINTLPRVALVPLIALIFGLGIMGKLAMSWVIVFFIVFFNSHAEGINVSPNIVDFCRVMGASSSQLVLTVRCQSCLKGMLASLPNAVAFSLVGVVFAETLTSQNGIGAILWIAGTTGNATDLMASFFILGAIGVVLLKVSEKVERKLLFWDPSIGM